MKSNCRRIEILDELRGFAIIAMIVHHFFLDVGDVLSLDWGYMIFDSLCTIQPLFWAIFIIISGICTRLSRNSIKRGLIVLAGAGIITLVTAVIMPKMGIENAEIYFGILHFMGCSMIITGLLMPMINKIKAGIGMVASAAAFFFFYGINARTLFFGLIKLPTPTTNLLAPLGLYNGSFHSADYFSLLPWIFIFLFGAFLGEYAKNGSFPSWCYKKHSKALAFVGRNSLWIYLGHQAVLYALLYAFLGLLSLYIKIKMM